MSYLKEYYKRAANSENASAVQFYAGIDAISKTFPEIAQAILQELKDQRANLKLIASENYCSLAVQAAMGTLLTDKYSEGYIRHRFYAGCDNVDKVEELAVNLAKKIFNAEHAYVQPHSGADANMVAYWAILVHKIQNPEIVKLNKKSIFELSEEEHEKIRQLMINQKIMGMALDAGGHLTHGYRLNISSKMMKSVPYGLNPETCLLDYALLEKQVRRERPLILLAGFSAYPRNLNFAKLKEIANTVGAVLIVDMAHFAGLVAGKVLTNQYDPIGYADIVTSTTHKTLRGPRGGLILCKGEYKEVIDKGCPLVLGGPLPHVMAAKAIAFKEADSKEFCLYAHQIIKNSKALAERLLKNGVEIITKGTDNHLVLIDVFKSFKINGRQAENALCGAALTVNRNAILNDQNGPWYTSGVRLGTAAVTTLGMKEDEMKEIADIITKILANAKSKTKSDGGICRNNVEIAEKVISEARDRVKNLLGKHILYPELVC